MKFNRCNAKNYKEGLEKENYDKFFGSWAKYECKFYGEPRKLDLVKKQDNKTTKAAQNIKHKSSMSTSSLFYL